MPARSWIVRMTVLGGAGLLGCSSSASAPAPNAPVADAGGDASDGGLRAPDLPPVPPLPTFPGDPQSEAEVTLGAQIFFDVRLSGTQTTNCNSCHLVETLFQDNLAAATPDRTKPGQTPKLPRST